MSRFVERHLAARRGAALRVLDVGSQDVNGTYKPLFADPAWEYVGADMEAGANVDLVLADPYDWREVRPASFDVVISGQTLEHAEFPWMTMREIRRALRPGGVCCVIAPSAGPVHRYPVDCWRILADGMAGLGVYAGLETVETYVFDNATDSTGQPNMWHDCVLVARRPAGRASATLLESVQRRLDIRLFAAHRSARSTT